MKTNTRLMVRAPWLVLAVLLLGCDDANMIGGENVLIVTNLQDRFTFSIMALDDVTDSERHLWLNSGTRAEIDITQAITQGSAILQLRDGEGTVVYSEDIAADIDATTPTGVAGIWQIDVVMSSVTGEFSFSIDRAS